MDQSTQPTQTTPPMQPKNWMVESILVTLFCCIILGIIGIVNAAKVNSEWAAGRYAEAERASKEAGKWTKLGFFIGIGLYVIMFICYFIFGLALFGAAASLNNN